MAYNFKKMFGSKVIAGFLLFTLISTSLFSSFTPRVYATGFPVVDALHTGVTTAESFRKVALEALNAAAMFAAQLVIERMVASTVRWANNGFEGGPAYATDPRQYFTDLADGIAGEYIQGDSNLNFLCSPFQANIRLSLAHQYYDPQPFQCTFTEVIGNATSSINAFLEDFDNGGWKAWFSMTQNPTNNPYGAYLSAKIDMDSQILEALNLETDKLNWNQGFLSWSDCIELNPPAINDSGSSGTLPSRNLRHIPGKAVGECIQRGPTKTPGSVIKSQLDEILPSGLEKLITVEHINQLAAAFAGGLLQRFVFGPQGLFSRNSNYQYAPTTFQNLPGLNLPTPGAGYSTCTAACDARYCRLPSGQNNEAPAVCEPAGEYNACLAACSSNVGGGRGVTHTQFASNPDTVQITATLPNLPTGTSLYIRVDGTDKFSCPYTPCNYSNTYADGTYTYDAYYLIEGDLVNIPGGTFTVPYVPTAPPPTSTTTPPTGGGGFTNLLNDVRAERNRYGANISYTEAATILNIVAWNNRASGWGLSRKTDGQKCPSGSGSIACDILHHRDTNIIVDVFGSGPSDAVPYAPANAMWEVLGPQFDAGRPWVAPTQP